MQAEWLALWAHFLWSGALTTVFCITAWWKTRFIAVMQKTFANRNIRQEEGSRPDSSRKQGPPNEATKQRRRVLRIAAMVTICMLLMAAATLSTSVALEEWNRTADVALACEIKESWVTRNWDAYGLNEEEVVTVCSREEANINPVHDICEGSCTWYPSITTVGLMCHVKWMEEEFGAKSLEEFAAYIAASRKQGSGNFPTNGCNCPCDALIEIERPSLGVLALAYTAQSFVVVIVGLNLGFRKDYLDIWAKLVGAYKSTAITVRQQRYAFNSKAYDEPSTQSS